MKAKCFGSRPVSGVNWFEGAEGDEKRIADFIKIIEDAIK
jgi:hypothetical protein